MSKAVLSSIVAVSDSQRDKAYQLLRRLLILQQVREGERLREPEWSARLGVNRMALREAFARLEAEGLIDRGPRTGYVVPQLSDEDIQEILEVRSVLEATAVERIIRSKRNTRKLLAPLQDAVDQLQSLIEQSYLLGASEADRRFHECLIELGGSRRLTMIYQRAPLPMLHGRIIDTPQWEAEMRRTLTEHREIVELILKSETRKAQNALRDHLSDRSLRDLHGPR